MIHRAYKKTVLAYLYYKKLGKDYDEDQARKQFAQDNNINEKVLHAVLKEIYKEATK